jgi:hypothetical protein
MYRNQHRRAAAVIVIAVLVAAAGVSAGCLWAPDLAMVRKDIERQLPGVSFEKEIELTLGPVSLAFARLVARITPEAVDASGYLSDVSRIELAVYNTEDMPPAKSVQMPERLRLMQESEGWELAVRMRDDDELAWVLYRTDGDEVKELYVVVVSDDELVMVKAEGRLERLVARALTDSGALKNIGEPHG